MQPGKLTAEDSMIMNMHPQYAYDLLAPIIYLNPTMEIPTCHHEKWDGSGHPRGLKGSSFCWQPASSRWSMSGMLYPHSTECLLGRLLRHAGTLGTTDRLMVGVGKNGPHCSSHGLLISIQGEWMHLTLGTTVRPCPFDRKGKGMIDPGNQPALECGCFHRNKLFMFGTHSS
jgi:hypothetical protein